MSLQNFRKFKLQYLKRLQLQYFEHICKRQYGKHLHVQSSATMTLFKHPDFGILLYSQILKLSEENYSVKCGNGFGEDLTKRL
jgi:hypothetical protein